VEPRYRQAQVCIPQVNGCIPAKILVTRASPVRVAIFPLLGGFDAKDLVFATSFPSADTIESITIVSHKFTRSRKIYHSKQSALKILYMAIHAVSKQWTMPIRHWKQAQSHSAVLYEDRMPELTSK